jgi:hypothetical protein
MLEEDRANGSELEAHGCVCVGMRQVFGQHRHEHVQYGKE